MDIISNIKESQDHKDEIVNRINAAIVMQCFTTKSGITINLANIDKYKHDMTLDESKRKEWQRIYDIYKDVPGTDYITPINL